LIPFAIVAPVCSLTQRDYITNNSTGAIGRCNWYPMVHRERMPQPTRSTASHAAIIEIVQTILPVPIGERIRKIPFSGLPALVDRIQQIAMIAIVSVFSCCCSLWMILIILGVVQCSFGYVIRSIPTILFFNLIAVRLFVFRVSGAMFYQPPFRITNLAKSLNAVRGLFRFSEKRFRFPCEAKPT